jgi:hypothetical protein
LTPAQIAWVQQAVADEAAGLPLGVSEANAVRVLDDVPWQQRVRLACLEVALRLPNMDMLNVTIAVNSASQLEDYVLNGYERPAGA